jgi:HNH endonuclease
LPEPRGTPPPKYAIAAYWAEREMGFVYDIGEPSCFACGWYNPRWHTYGNPPNCTDLVSIWRETRGLEIAHLKPHSLGGSVAVDNLVLLCVECHLDAPDFADPSYMLAWMRNRDSYVGRQLTFLQDAIKTFRPDGLNADEIAKITKTLDDDVSGLSGYANENCTLHPGGSAVATYLSALFEYCGIPLAIREAA